MMDARTAHPTPATLAAFIDGRLTGDERSRVVAHLADCGECFEVVAETVEIQEELEAEEAAPSRKPETPGPPGETGWPDNVVVHPRARWLGKPAWRVGFAAAAAVAIAMLGAWHVGWLWPPGLSGSSLARSVAGATARLDPAAWKDQGWGVPRGNDFSLGEKRASFKVGVLTLDLQTALRAGDAVRALGLALELVRAQGDDSLSYISSIRRSYELEVIEPLERGASPASVLNAAEKRDRETRGLLADTFYDLGKWAEAGRLAAHAEDRSALRSRAIRIPIPELREKLTGDPDVEDLVPQTLDQIEEMLEWRVNDQELRRLRRDFNWIVAGLGVRLTEPVPAEPEPAGPETSQPEPAEP